MIIHKKLTIKNCYDEGCMSCRWADQKICTRHHQYAGPQLVSDAKIHMAEWCQRWHINADTIALRQELI